MYIYIYIYIYTHIYINIHIYIHIYKIGLPCGKESACQCRKHRFNPQVEEEMATLSTILAWKIPRTEEPGRLQSVGSQRVDTTSDSIHTHIYS